MKYLYDIIKNQLYNLNELGYNYLTDIKLLDREDVYEFVEFMHRTYLPIHQYERIIQNDIELYKVFNYCYQLYVIDFINDILPFLRDIGSTISCESLTDLRDDLFKFISTRVNNLSKLPELESEKLKYLFYMDLFDSDLKNFCLNYLTPVLSKVD